MRVSALVGRAAAGFYFAVSACGGEEDRREEMSNGPDALRDGSTPASGDAGAPPCGDTDPDTLEIVDPALGCGHRKGPWTHYDLGLDIDETTGLVWSSLLDVWNDEELDVTCRGLARGGLAGFRIPTIEEVRTLAAGCPQTLPAGACAVRGNVRAEYACTGCEAGRGPHESGGYCRPELPDCSLLWTANYCEDDHCGGHQHWFYAPDTGAIALRPLLPAAAMAVEGALGRCVTTLPGR